MRGLALLTVVAGCTAPPALAEQAEEARRDFEECYVRQWTTHHPTSTPMPLTQQEAEAVLRPCRASLDRAATLQGQAEADRDRDGVARSERSRRIVVEMRQTAMAELRGVR